MFRRQKSPALQVILLLLLALVGWWLQRPATVRNNSPVGASNPVRIAESNDSGKHTDEFTSNPTADSGEELELDGTSREFESNKDARPKSLPISKQPFDYYVLALSWSPSYCRDNQHDSEQCGRDDLGLVVHGLWPQQERGQWPRACSTERMDAASLRAAENVFPTRRLALHEWQEHGTCSGKTPAEYVQLTAQAFQKVTLPTALQDPRKPPQWRFEKLEQAFVDANPDLGKRGVSLICGKGVLQEIRVCFDLDLNFRECGKGVNDRCRDVVRIPKSGQ